MNNRLEIELDTLETGFPIQYEQETMPDGAVRTISVWNPERLAAMVEYVKNNIDAAGKDVVYKGIVSCWIMQAVENVMEPHRAFHVTAYLDGKEVEMKALPIGEPDPKAGLEFEFYEDGEDLYICVTCDDQSIDYHNYDVELFKYAKAPPIPEGKNVYLRVKGATCCILTLAKTYQPFCKSLHMWAFHDNFKNRREGQGQIYGCAYTTTDEHKLGVLVERER